MISEKKLKEIMLYLVENGEKATIKTYNISPATLERYKRQDKFYKTKIPKVLLLDIETSMIKAYVWDLWKQNVHYDCIIKDWYILAWAAKWLFSADMYSGVLTSEEAKVGYDKRILQGLWELMEESEVIIWHNGDRFDKKRIKTRFLLNGLKPTMPYQSIDTLSTLRSMKFSSNRLDFIGKLIRNKGKKETNRQLWIRCMKGEQEALNEMSAYNQEDVFLLEEAYLWLRPWIKSHPNLGIFMESTEPVCSHCGSSDLNWGGAYTTMVSSFAAFRCNNCGAPGRCRVSSLNKEQREELTVSIARL